MRARWSASSILQARAALTVAGMLAGSLLGCAGDDTNPPVPDAGAGDASLGDAGAPRDAGEAGATPAATGIRVAQWSAGAPPVDFCLAPHATGAFVLFGTPGSPDAGSDAGSPTLTFPQVTAYSFLAPGTYDLRAVVGGASDCAIGVAPDLTSLHSLASGALTTIALVGTVRAGTGGASALALAAYPDDVEPKAAVSVRVINASPSLSQADFGTGTLTKAFNPLFPDVPFGAAGSVRDGGPPDASPSIDPNGYASVGALAGATVSAHAVGATSDSLVAPGVFAAAGSVITFVLLDRTDPTLPPQVLECVDNAGTVGALAACNLLPTQ